MIITVATRARERERERKKNKEADRGLKNLLCTDALEKVIIRRQTCILANLTACWF